MDFNDLSLKLHKELGGKLEVISKVEINDRNDLSVAYSPGVAAPCLAIAKDEKLSREYTINGNTIAVISDGTAVLGLGNIGAKASLPVMEGKCLLFKEFGGVNAFPIVLETTDTEEIIKTIKIISGTFAGINLEDISAPRCFEIEERLKNELDIPVFHDDQHGTAIVVLAGLINSLKLTNRTAENSKVIINGVGAAGIAICNLLLKYGFEDIILVDSTGAIYEGREDLNDFKKELAKKTNSSKIKGNLEEAIKGRDIFIGVSKGNIVSEEMVKSMNSNSIIFGLANPIPEIMPANAYNAGAAIVATGRSDFPNQVNNVLVFPGIFKGAIQNKVQKITDEIKINAAIGLANYVKNPSKENIIPDSLDKNVAEVVANYVK